MVLSIDKKHVSGYIITLFFVLMSVTCLLCTTRNEVIASDPTDNSDIGQYPNDCEGSNQIVGYNLGGYGCDDAETVLDRATRYGNTIEVLMDRDCKQPNSGFDITAIVSKARSNGAKVIIRLYPGGSIMSSREDIVSDVRTFANCLSRIPLNSGSRSNGHNDIIIDPHNEVNMCREMTLFNCNQDAMAQGMATFLMEVKYQIHDEMGFSVLFPSMNSYPNPETFDPRSYITKMINNGLSVNWFSGISLHVYGGSDVYLYDGYGGGKLTSCQDPWECVQAVYKASTGYGVLNFSQSQWFVTETGYINGAPIYQDPYTASWLRSVWTELSGKIAAALPFVFDPDLEYDKQCSGYKLFDQGISNPIDSSVGSSYVVAYLAYGGCFDRMKSLDLASLKNSLDSLYNSGFGLNCSKKTRCGDQDICKGTWTCCGGKPVLGSVCIWPEWGKYNAQKCEGMEISGKLMCTDKLETSRLDNISVGPTKETMKVACNPKFTVGVSTYPYGFSMPMPAFSSIAGAVIHRLSVWGGFPVLLPKAETKVWDNAPYVKELKEVKVDPGSSGLTISPNQQATQISTEETALVKEKSAKSPDYTLVPGGNKNIISEPASSTEEEDFCEDKVSRVKANGVKYCKIVNPTTLFDPVERIVNAINTAINPCEVDTKKIYLKVESDLYEVYKAYTKKQNYILGLPGDPYSTSSDEAYVETKCYLNGQEFNCKIWFEGFLPVGTILCDMWNWMRPSDAAFKDTASLCRQSWLNGLGYSEM